MYMFSSACALQDFPHMYLAHHELEIVQRKGREKKKKKNKLCLLA